MRLAAGRFLAAERLAAGLTDLGFLTAFAGFSVFVRSVAWDFFKGTSCEEAVAAIA